MDELDVTDAATFWDASFIAISQDEYANFVENTIQLVVKRLAEKNLV